MRNGHNLEPTEATVVSVSGGLEVNSPLQEYEGFPGFDNRRATTDPNSLLNEKPRAIRRENTIDPRDLPEVIPPEHSHRTLIVCFDGTGDQFDADNSNIVQLVSLLKKDDKNKQLVYYQVC